MKTTITDVLLAVVIVAWTGSVVLNMYDRSFKIPGTVEAAMAAVVGYLLGSKFLKGSKNGDQEKKL